MADNNPDQVAIGTLITEVIVTAQDLQAQDRILVVNDDKALGSRAERPGVASVGSLGSRAAIISIASRAGFSSSGSTASVASAATIVSEPSIASQGSTVAIASVAGQVSKAVLAPSQGSVASVAADASTVAGKVSVTLRNKQQIVDISRIGSQAAFVEVLPPVGQLIAGKNKHLLRTIEDSISVYKHEVAYHLTGSS